MASMDLREQIHRFEIYFLYWIKKKKEKKRKPSGTPDQIKKKKPRNLRNPTQRPHAPRKRETLFNHTGVDWKSCTEMTHFTGASANLQRAPRLASVNSYVGLALGPANHRFLALHPRSPEIEKPLARDDFPAFSMS